ncbi:hypothetical protein UlMin_020747 [Ulmus minor]
MVEDKGTISSDVNANPLHGYNSSSYLYYIRGDDEIVEDLERELKEKLEQERENVVKRAKELEQTAEEHDSKLEAMKAEPSRREVVEKNTKLLEEDAVKFRTEKVLKEKEKELEVKEQNRERISEENVGLKKMVEQQAFNAKDVERMRRELQAVERDIGDAEIATSSLENKSWDLHSSSGYSFKELQTLAIESNQANKRLKFGDGFQFAMNAKGSTPAEVMGVDYKSKLKPALASFADDIKKNSTVKLEELIALQQQLSNIAAKVEGKKNKTETLQSHINVVEAQPNKLKKETEEYTYRCASEAEKTEEDLEMEARNLDVVESEQDDILKVPASINCRLLEHQRGGVKFLYSLYKNNHGGILGDDMGLGKTIQTIAFLAAVFGKDGDYVDCSTSKRNQLGKNDPVLIVCPTSVIHNWESEFSKWSSFSVSVYHGANRDLIYEKLKAREGEVLITSFDTYRIHGSILSEVNWDIVIVDEAHRLKNEKSKLYGACLEIKTLRRFGLTGTIMQNKIMELFNLFDWVAPGSLGTREHFREFYDEPLKHGQRSTAPERFVQIADKRKQHLVAVLRKYLLRRTKEETIGHLMMGKEDNVVFCVMSELQKRVYSRMLQLPDIQCLINKDLPCSCGSPLTQVECCKRIVPDGVIWPYLHRDSPDGCDSCPFCIVLPCLVKLQQVFLISTRAGGLGLNLVSANRVVIFDPNWNPAQDLQAQDRSFRYGQKRHVVVFRLLAAGSLEELVYSRQVYKQQLSNIAVSGKMEKRYFEGVQDCKEFQGELFGICNLFRDLSDKLFTSDIIELHGKQGEHGHRHHSKQESNELRNDILPSKESGLTSLSGSETNITHGSKKPTNKLVLEDLGIVYAHRNQDVVNYGPGIEEKLEMDIPQSDSLRKGPSVPVARRKVGGKENVSSPEYRKRIQFSLLARSVGMGELEFSKWLFSAAPWEREKVLQDYKKRKEKEPNG